MADGRPPPVTGGENTYKWLLQEDHGSGFRLVSGDKSVQVQSTGESRRIELDFMTSGAPPAARQPRCALTDRVEDVERYFAGLGEFVRDGRRRIERIRICLKQSEAFGSFIAQFNDR